MKLSELLDIIDYEYDFADKEWDTTFYAYANKNKYTKQIEVFRISTDYVVCDFTKFINKHKKLIRDKIYDAFDLAWASFYSDVLNNPRIDEDAYCDIIICKIVGELLEEEETE